MNYPTGKTNQGKENGSQTMKLQNKCSSINCWTTPTRLSPAKFFLVKTICHFFLRQSARFLASNTTSTHLQPFSHLITILVWNSGYLQINDRLDGKIIVTTYLSQKENEFVNGDVPHFILRHISCQCAHYIESTVNNFPKTNNVNFWKIKIQKYAAAPLVVKLPLVLL